ncbi:MAG: hypothetical protein HY929_03625 [Euryarchaeota archaeon]|nr:hypothetical protein [Euryarchaeota archaeon]
MRYKYFKETQDESLRFGLDRSSNVAVMRNGRWMKPNPLSKRGEVVSAENATEPRNAKVINDECKLCPA